MKETEKLLNFYQQNKNIIKNFLENTEKDHSDDYVFGELCFCLLTPQSVAKICRNVIDELKSNEKIFTAGLDELRIYLKGVRFPNVKAQRIIEAREKFPELKKKLNSESEELREWLVDNVNGIGMKESAHFMRNIGFKGLAIIDIHIQNFLKKIGIIDQIKSLTRKRYLELERKFLKLSKKMKISPEELDIAIWLYESGEENFYG